MTLLCASQTYTLLDGIQRQMRKGPEEGRLGMTSKWGMVAVTVAGGGGMFQLGDLKLSIL